jgi:hypothetical protein
MPTVLTQVSFMSCRLKLRLEAHKPLARWVVRMAKRGQASNGARQDRLFAEAGPERISQMPSPNPRYERQAMIGISAGAL